MPTSTLSRKTPAQRPPSPAPALQQLVWTPVDQSKTQTVDLLTGGQRLDVAGISGPVAAWSVPANIGELTLTLTSEVNKQKQIFAPNVLILDQNMTPSAFFPSSYFTYQQPGVMTADRLEGVMRLTPGAGAAEALRAGHYDGKRFTTNHDSA